jgi:UDP-N-acetylglucosamine 2-epimerase (non-hydrolysing)
MPEEINRVLTDQISDLLFTTEASAQDNLQREGVDASKVHFVGNVMIDTLLAHRERARTTEVHRTLGLDAGEYALMTLHRPSNVDETEAFERLMRGIAAVAHDVPVVFPGAPANTAPSRVRQPPRH